MVSYPNPSRIQFSSGLILICLKKLSVSFFLHKIFERKCEIVFFPGEQLSKSTVYYCKYRMLSLAVHTDAQCQYIVVFDLKTFLYVHNLKSGLMRKTMKCKKHIKAIQKPYTDHTKTKQKPCKN